MSKPRYNWWPFALNMIRDYPRRLRDHNELKRQQITPSPDGASAGGSDISRVVERLAMRQLPPQEQREFDAVTGALERTKTMTEGKVRCEVVKMTMWRGYDINGAARICNVSWYTARRYRWQFILLVGMLYGFLDEAEFKEAVRRDQEGG